MMNTLSIKSFSIGEITVTMDTQVELMSNILENVEDVNAITKRLDAVIRKFSI